MPYQSRRHIKTLIIRVFVCVFWILVRAIYICIANIANKSPKVRRHSSVSKKHVQFPEDFKYVEEEEEILCTTDSNGTGSGTGSASGWIMDIRKTTQIVSSRNEFTETMKMWRGIHCTQQQQQLTTIGLTEVDRRPPSHLNIANYLSYMLPPPQSNNNNNYRKEC